MPEKELKEYWYVAYAKALTMLQHPEKVTEKEIAVCIKQTGNGVFNRLFCLAVWQEVKLQKEGKTSMPQGRYKDAITDVWRIFKQYSSAEGSNAYWDGLVQALWDIMDQYGNCQFITDLAVHVVLESIEDICRKREGKPVFSQKLYKNKIRKFEVGKVYKGRNGKEYKCTKRTERTVWFDNCRHEIKRDSERNEYTTTVVHVTDVEA